MKKVLILVEDQIWLNMVEKFVLELVGDRILDKHLRRRDDRVISTQSMTVEIVVNTGYSMVGKRADLVLNLCHFMKDDDFTAQEYHKQVVLPIMRYRG